MLYKNANERKHSIRDFLQNNPDATYKDIKKLLHIKIEKVYVGGIEEAFIDAKVKPPRNFERKTKDQRRKIIVDYIKKHPRVGGHTIAKNTKINPSNVFKNIKEAYNLAGVEYPRGMKKNKRERREEIINLVKQNPLISINEIISTINTSPYKFFKNFSEIYKMAQLKNYVGSKRKIKKQIQIINYIKQNNLATQREINFHCKTRVQELFSKGIFEAYEKAEVEFPYERLRSYGIGIKAVRDRAKSFEDQVAMNLSGYGEVNRLIRTKRGMADIVFEKNGKKAIIEVKDYRQKEISISQINQLNKYLEDVDCSLGFLVCHTKPLKHKFIIGKNTILILTEEELNLIPRLIKGL